MGSMPDSDMIYFPSWLAASRADVDRADFHVSDWPTAMGIIRMIFLTSATFAVRGQHCHARVTLKIEHE